MKRTLEFRKGGTNAKQQKASDECEGYCDCKQKAEIHWAPGPNSYALAFMLCLLFVPRKVPLHLRGISFLKKQARQ